MFSQFPGRLVLSLFALLLAALVVPSPAQAQDDGLLEVTKAFQLTASVPEAGSILLKWKIADDYYLYRGRISAKALDDSVQLGTLQLPDGKKEHDEFLGDVEVYHHGLTANLPYQLAAGHDGPIRVAIQFQGCHEVDPKICYPPYSQTLDLTPPVEAAPAAAPTINLGGGSLSGALGQLSGASSMGLSDAGPLPPEQAFHFEAIADSPTALLARFTMPKGYYLYRSKSHIELASGDGITLGTAQWPKGVQHNDENFGTTEVFFGEADIRIPIGRTSGDPQTMTVKTVFQGCQDGGLCYPLMTREVSLDLPAATKAQLASASAAATAAPGPENSVNGPSEEQRLAGSLSGPNRWLALLLFFGGGLLLAFTPCVLPMVPILSGLIAGAGENISTRRAFVLSVVYVLATAVVFTIAGVIAGVAGANLQAAFQTPWVLWLFAGVFVLLSLSMFGFYELQLPAALQNRLTRASNSQKPGSLTGVAVMGVLSALIVGPCVAPPLAAAVLYIAERQDPVFGGLALFALSLGMGVPLVIFGTAAGKLLPRAGTWMNAVKAVFGVLFLGLAIWMLTRILDPLWIMLMAGALLIACAVYMGALERIAEGASGWRRLWKALGLIALIIGAAELIGAAAGSRDLLQPLGSLVSSTSTQTAAHLDFRTVKTVDDLDRALSAASQAGQPVMLDFYADWCVSCKEMERFTYSKPDVQQALSGFVLLKVDVTANDDADKAMLKRYKLYGPPATIFYDTHSQEQRGLRLIGFEKAADFARRVQQASGQTP